jgi:hypothetical protein
VSVARFGERLPSLTWVQKALLFGGALWLLWGAVGYSGGVAGRALHDAVIYIGGPALLGVAYRKRMGWRVDRTAVVYTVLLTLFVLPFYLVGSSLPSIRAQYPLWSTEPTLAAFLPHAIFQFVVALAAESYYRGLMCVGVRDLGRKAALVSPVLYAARHVSKPPVELLLSAPTDVLFGLVDYESDSILPSVVAHGVGLNVLDWLVLHDPVLPPEQVVTWLSWLPIQL